MFRLVDDGTLDTVLRCDVCGEYRRFNFVESGYNDASEFLKDILEEAEYEHDENECYEDAQSDDLMEMNQSYLKGLTNLR